MKHHFSTGSWRTPLTLLVLLVAAGRDAGASPSCPSPDAAFAKLDDFRDQAMGCAENLKEAEDLAADGKKYYDRRIQLSNLGKTIVDAADDIGDLVKKQSTIVGAIPKFGKLINQVNDALQTKFVPIMNRIIGDIDSLKKTRTRFDTARKRFKDLGKLATDSGKAAGDTRAVLEHAVAISTTNNCCKTAAIDQFAEGVIVEQPYVDYATEAFAQCGTRFDIDLPQLDFGDLPDIALFEKITPAIDDIIAWITDAVDEILDKIAVDICCRPGLAFVLELLEGISKIVNLASCVFDGAVDATINESLDVILPLIEPIVDKINGKLDGHNAFIRDINDGLGHFNNFPNFAIESAAVNEFFQLDTCAGIVTMEATWFDFDLDPVEFEAIPTVTAISLAEGDGKFDFKEIGQSIAIACEEAVDAFKDPEDADCCAAAREEAGIPIEGWWNGHGCAYDEACESETCFGDSPSTKNCQEPPSLGDECGTHSHCEIETRNGHCQVLKWRDGGSVCYPADKKAAAGMPCVTDWQCDDDLFCSSEEHNFPDLRLKFRKCTALRKHLESCGGHHDCADGLYCNGGTCYDGRDGSRCGVDGDCDNYCVGHVCESGQHGASCGTKGDCSGSLDCVQNTCTDGRLGSRCGVDGHCQSTNCVSGQCTSGAHGQPCGGHADCDGYCNNRICYDGRSGSRCSIHRDCKSDKCPPTGIGKPKYCS